ncbi:stage III sporulation protein AH [Melghirimyces profundicolus]|uniref:Stage III sporulation protein AH n=1 Tax=Melghirimyces profundicolus TaxID=1242148 RepID=A0A2T6BD28_9BACL|nr:SpoIIIAH-like family protein [Melghirimyces profundicolus]PTX53922.1 stage III sporulation protein AH [Melghirimyces profundicolus]
MNMNKQTVWLVTMLTLMVVLSAYYIVTGPVEPADQVTMEDQQSEPDGIKVDTDEKKDGEKKQEKDKKASAESDSDYFVGYQLERSSLRSKMTEEYMKVLTDPDASKKELKEAQAKIDELMKVDKTESVMEDLIREEGFRDAVVITGEDHFVDVIVQSKKLNNKQVVKLISIVKKQMDVPSHKISIAYRS